MGSDEHFHARHAEAQQSRSTTGIHAVNGKDVLCKVDAYGYDGHGLPLSIELMRIRTSHRGTQLPSPASSRAARDGEVPFIR